MDLIASLPDGTDSLEFDQTRQEYRGAILQNLQQGSTVEYGIPMAHLEGARQRSEYLPFNPTNRFSLEMQSIRYEEEQVQRIRSFMNSDSVRRAGGLTEEQTLQLTTQVEGLRTQEARGLSTLANGMEDYLPPMQANRPASFSRYDSLTLASLRFGQRAPWVRAYGAFNGIQEQAQTDFANSFGAGSIEPFSRNAGLDNARAGDSHAMNRAADAMQRAADALQNIAGGRQGSPNRPGAAAGSLNQTLNMHSIPPQNTGYN
jgi:hypothetical protein